MDNKKVKAAEKLIADIKNKFAKWNERSQFTMKGIKNLSVSDLEVLDLYANQFLLYGSFNGLMEPRGSIEAVLQKYLII